MQKAKRSSTPPPRRAYNSAGRQADARERQRRVVDAATRLFLAQGYGATSIEQIAKEAEVSAPMVYAAFESKAGVLSRAVDIAVAGDDAPIPVGDRPESEAVRRGDDIDRRFRDMAHVAREGYERSAALLTLIEGVEGTDPVLADLAQKLRAGRRVDIRRFVDSFPPTAWRRDFDADQIVNTLEVVADTHAYTLLTRQGYSGDEYEAWILDAVTKLVRRA